MERQRRRMRSLTLASAWTTRREGPVTCPGGGGVTAKMPQEDLFLQRGGMHWSPGMDGL